MEEIDGSEVHRFKTNGITLKKETLEKLIEDTFFKEEPKKLHLTTGVGGARDMGAALFKIPPHQVTQQHLQAMINMGFMTVREWEEGGQQFQAFDF